MIMKLENPLSFNTDIVLPNNKRILYLKLIEICQGGPEVGILSINEKIIEKELFGGPLLYKDDYIYVPCFKRKWFNSGFYIAKINIETLNYTFISDMHPVIDLINIKDDIIYFYKDINQHNIGNIVMR